MVWAGGNSTKQRPAEERFDEKVRVDESGCWIWVGAHVSTGYGNFAVTRRKFVPAHRWSYERHVGPIPDGLELDHLCRNRACVNPAHLEPVTHLENVRRGPNVTKRHCVHGHPRTRENQYIAPKTGYADCLTCRRRREAERKAGRRTRSAA